MGRLLALFVFLVLFVGTSPDLSPQLPPSVADQVPSAAPSSDFPLTIRNIMKGSEHLGQPPVGVAWTDDSRWVYFRWLAGGQEWHDTRNLYRVGRDGGIPELVDVADQDSVAILFAPGALSPDRRWRASSVGGDLYLVDRRSMEVRRLTDTQRAVGAPTFSMDGQTLHYRVGNNIFARDRTDGSVRQLTNIQSGPAPKDSPEAVGHEAFLKDQQSELFAHIRTDSIRAQRREDAQERRESRDARPFFLAARENPRSLVVDPQGRWAVAVLATSPTETKGTMVPDWVTGSGYTEELNVRTKVGDDQSDHRVIRIDLVTGESMDLDTQTEETKTEDGNPALSSIRFGGWSHDGSYALIMSTDYEYKNWRLFSMEGATGDLTLLYTLHDEAWVGGPCHGCMGWIPGTDRAWYVAEETGYSHLYAINADGSDLQALTQGEWEVQGVSIPEDRDRFHLVTSESSPYEAHAVWMDFDGDHRDALTSGLGSYRAVPSPDGSRVALTYSAANQPPELFLADNKPGAEKEQVTKSPTAEWQTFPWIQPEIVTFTAEDGTEVPARIYRPTDVGAEATGAAVIFVHGAGYLHNVHTWWSNYSREYMFHHYLAASGYTVLDIDYRGSAGYGRDWRTGIYRWMGGKDLSDQVDGVKYLTAFEGVDPERVGIYGGSYGGFITLMGLFTEPDVFAAGAALRSVTDWAHYNHGYTGRILNFPDSDEEAYRKSSPIYFAEGFKGDLLIAHGMVDTNVHFSDVVRLAQRLIELGKENWEMAVYPVESHGFIEPTSWTDEYRRIFELFEKSIGER